MANKQNFTPVEWTKVLESGMHKRVSRAFSSPWAR